LPAVPFAHRQAQRRLEALTFGVLERFANGAPPSGQQQQQQQQPARPPASTELVAFAPLVTSALKALAAAGDGAFRRQLPDLFPVLARLVQCDHATPDVQRALSDLLMGRVGPLLGSGDAVTQAGSGALLAATSCG
jgi:brefeldin A-inhibited guanine nucleotide-exchange protein